MKRDASDHSSARREDLADDKMWPNNRVSSAVIPQLNKETNVMSKGATQPTVRETADETKGYELDTNLPDEAQGKTSRGKHKSKQSTEDEHNATGSVDKQQKEQTDKHSDDK